MIIFHDNGLINISENIWTNFKDSSFSYYQIQLILVCSWNQSRTSLIYFPKKVEYKQLFFTTHKTESGKY